MRTRNHLNLLAVSVAALALNVSTSPGQIFSPADALNNRAVAASPRAKEAFPWLTRTAAPRTETCCAADALAQVKKNRAFATSPRVLEQFPELSRAARTQPEFTIAPLVEKNAALLSSPRYRENHPEVSRGTAKGGASKLMEPGK